MCNDTSFLFPTPVPHPAILLKDNPGGTFLQAAPVLAILLVWFAFETNGDRRSASVRMKRFSHGAASIAISVQAVLLMRFFDIMDECSEGMWVDYVTPWRYVCMIAVIILNGVLLLIVSPKFPRVAITTTVSSAVGIVFVDWSLRGGFVVSSAAYPLVALQQCVCIVTVSMLYDLPASRRPLRPGHAKHGGGSTHGRPCASVPSIDALC